MVNRPEAFSLRLFDADRLEGLLLTGGVVQGKGRQVSQDAA